MIGGTAVRAKSELGLPAAGPQARDDSELRAAGARWSFSNGALAANSARAADDPERGSIDEESGEQSRKIKTRARHAQDTPGKPARAKERPPDRKRKMFAFRPMTDAALPVALNIKPKQDGKVGPAAPASSSCKARTVA